jgi:hypothetical protein
VLLGFSLFGARVRNTDTKDTKFLGIMGSRDHGLSSRALTGSLRLPSVTCERTESLEIETGTWAAN